MSLFAATLITGIGLLLLGGVLVVRSTRMVSVLQKLPRSQTMAYVLFGSGAVWFLYRIANLSAADFGDFKRPLFVFFAVVAIGAFKYVPDFLAVRGACVLTLLAGSHLLDPGYMVWDYGEVTDFGAIYLYKVAVFVALALAIYLGASPFRVRDFLEWLYRKPGRAQWVGGVVATYGLMVVGSAFTY